MLVKGWYFPGDAVAISPKQRSFCIKREPCPVYKPASFVRLGVVMLGPRERENAQKP